MALMAKILVLYNTPSDAAAFDSYYRSTHTPIAKKLPGLISYTISAQTPRAIAGEAPHLVAELEFASMDAIEAALASPEGQATAADLGNFAQTGATIVLLETERV